jgi:hypothetical protein
MLSSAGRQDFVHAILNKGELTSVEHHTNLRVFKKELNIFSATPRNLR